MTVEVVHQFVPAVAEADATSAHAVQARAVLRGMGIPSEIYVAEGAPLVEGVLPVSAFSDRPGVAVIYQFAIGSTLTDRLLASDVPLALNFHNLTPPEHYDAWQPSLATSLRWSMGQLRQLARRTTLGIAVSEYNAVELRRVGVREAVVAPILFDVATLPTAPEAAPGGAEPASGARWLFVGRLAPNKAQHDVIRAFAVYRRVFDPGAVLHLVGAPAAPSYDRALRSLARALGVESAVTFTGAVTPGELTDQYRAADVFVCLSEHEGFCVPLLEAMHHDTPIVAFSSSAVPETLGRAGLCLPEKSPAVVATAVHRVVVDTSLRDRLVSAGHERVAAYSLEHGRRRFEEAVRRFVELAEVARPEGGLTAAAGASRWRGWSSWRGHPT